MNNYKLDYTIEKTLQLKPSLEQKFLLEYTGKVFLENEAEKIWSRVLDHKWYVSERLTRNVGLRVAAVDYIENFYEPPVKNDKDNFTSYMRKLVRTAFHSIALSPSGTSSTKLLTQ